MSIAGMTCNIPKLYIDRSALKFFVHRTPKKRIICWDGQVRKVAIRNFTHLNPNVLLNNFELEAEIELLPLLADAGKHGLIKYVIQNETLFASRNILKINSRRGQFCGIPCKFVSTPKSYRCFFFRLCSDGKELEFRSPPFIENDRFLELLKMISAYQGTGNPIPSQILNAFQLWCAEQNRCDYFLTVDSNLIKVIRNQNRRPLTEVIKPSELMKIILNNPIRRTARSRCVSERT